MTFEKNNRAASEQELWQIRVRAEAHLDFWIEDYIDGLNIHHKRDGSSILTGELPDMPAVYGLILQLRDTGISILSLQVEKEIKGGGKSWLNT